MSGFPKHGSMGQIALNPSIQVLNESRLSKTTSRVRPFEYTSENERLNSSSSGNGWRAKTSVFCPKKKEVTSERGIFRAVHGTERKEKMNSQLSALALPKQFGEEGREQRWRLLNIPFRNLDPFPAALIKRHPIDFLSSDMKSFTECGRDFRQCFPTICPPCI